MKAVLTIITVSVVLSCVFSIPHHVQAQADVRTEAKSATIIHLQIGDTIPDALWHLPLQVVNHPEGRDTITLNDYRGKKLIILDFWATWCVPCVKSLDSLNIVQSEYPRDLQIVPIGNEAKDKIQRVIYRRDWNLFSTYDQSILKTYFPHRIVPHQIWIKSGLVLAITAHQYGTCENISKVLLDQSVPLYGKKDKISTQDKMATVLKDTTVLFQSKFEIYEPGASSGSSIRENLILCRNLSIGLLFKKAYQQALNSTVQNPVIWEVEDDLYNRLETERMTRDGVFENEERYDNWAKGFFYTYTLKGVGMSKEQLYERFRTDLNTFFGGLYGINAHIEYRPEEAIVLLPIERAWKQSESFGNQAIGAFQLTSAIRKNFPSIPIVIKDKQFYEMKFPNVDLGTDDIEILKKRLEPLGIDCRYENTAVPFLVIKQI